MRKSILCAIAASICLATAGCNSSPKSIMVEANDGKEPVASYMYIQSIVGDGFEVSKDFRKNIKDNGEWACIELKDRNTGEKGRVFSPIQFKVKDEKDSELVDKTLEKLDKKLTKDGFELVRTDEYQRRHYVRDDTEVYTGNIAGENRVLEVKVVTGTKTCCTNSKNTDATIPKNTETAADEHAGHNHS